MPEIVFHPSRIGNEYGERARYDEFLGCCHNGRGTWSCKKTAKEGDLYIFWFGQEEQKIAGIGVSQGDIEDDIEWRVCSFDPMIACETPITKGHIKSDPILGNWWKSRPFQGTPKKIKSDEVALRLLSLIRHLNPKMDPLLVEHISTIPGFIQSMRIPDDYENPPPRIKCMVTRVVRCTEKGESVKQLYDHECQLCGYRIVVPKSSATGYVEVHHMKPLGGKHHGLDNWNNMLVLCPNCHVEFDVLAIAIHPKTGKIVCCDTKHLNAGKQIQYRANHLLSPENIKYHYKRFQIAIGA